MAYTNENSLAPVLFLSHGGGPLPLLGHSGHAEMVRKFTELKDHLPVPDALLLISAHWETSPVEITGGANPPLIYDYYGFPPESYGIRYPAKGKPELARQVSQLLSESDIDNRINDRRGFDHGMFVPLKILYPEASIPVVQLSLEDSLDPAAHLRIGKALKRLRADNVMIVGSGFSFHNLSVFFSPKGPNVSQSVNEFTVWLDEQLTTSELSEENRVRSLESWEQAPNARFCHPREEHLLPLHCCLGAAENAVTDVFRFKTMNIESRCYLWNN
ncbi:DODA-type extradiol aromatic ring-opening family dioxygenase [Hahella ganghwensis]|uniref:DODA-type extradiol aromatic ring-opening family dioxygenase n=1 Tax=Hahella ganghwensis TaxID=286420 RepID=UPI00037FEE45|nr:class III extradiol ring-cleavage dioxygenase [Hahella ganghwensis]